VMDKIKSRRTFFHSDIHLNG